MDEAGALLERLARIEALDRDGAEPTRLLEELRALLLEAEAWARREGGDAATRAVGELRRSLARDMIER
jgi:hypothetical protein